MARAKQIEKADTAAFAHDALVIRTCGPKGESHNGFLWPLEIGSFVTCPDWKATCGNGLHGLLDGIGDWTLIEAGPERLWQVIGVRRAEVVVIDDQKVKFPRGIVLYTGNVAGAMALIQPEAVKRIQAEAKENIATGYSGHAAATGKHSIAASLGIEGAAMAGPDGWLVLAQWQYDDEWALIAVKSAKVGGPEGIKPHVYYRLDERGEFAEVRT